MKFTITGALVVILFCSCNEVLTFLSFHTASVQQSKPTHLWLPKDEKDKHTRQYNPAHTLTLILAGNDQVYYYSGNLTTAAQAMTSNVKSIRKALLQQQAQIGATAFTVLIKAAKGAAYKNIVDILDEMTINDIRNYAVEDMTEQEKSILKLEDQPSFD